MIRLTDQRWPDDIKTYSHYPTLLPIDQYRHVFQLTTYGLPYGYANYCAEFCMSAWAWWFVHDQTFLGFVEEFDALHFALSNYHS